jgi:lipopolysaccharide transport system permease protein
MVHENQWTEIITPKRSLFDLNLREIWRYRDLLLLFVRRDFVAQYKQTLLGPLWLLLQPLFTTITFFFIFNSIAQIPTDNIDPILFYLSGITLWNYFSDCFNKTSNTFVSNAGIFGKVYFPRLVTPISIVVSNLIKLGIQMLLFLIIAVFRMFSSGLELNIGSGLLLFPVLVLLMDLLGLGLGIIFSALTTKYRDLSFLLTFGIQLLMYATPVIYPLSFTSGTLGIIIRLNPLTPIIESFRATFFGNGLIDWLGLGYSALVTICVLFSGIVIFNRVEKSFMDTV